VDRRCEEQHVCRDHNHDGLRLAFLDLAQRVESRFTDSTFAEQLLCHKCQAPPLS